jgi:hypothetical protein
LLRVQGWGTKVSVGTVMEGLVLARRGDIRLAKSGSLFAGRHITGFKQRPEYLLNSKYQPSEHYYSQLASFGNANPPSTTNQM